jgi:hypothetical protein
MKDLFHKCYHTRVQALSELFAAEHDLRVSTQYGEDGQELPPDAAKASRLRENLRSVGIFTLEELQQFMNHSMAEHRAANKWRPDELDFIRKTVHELSHVSPEMFDIEYSLDWEGWFSQNDKYLNHQAAFNHISQAHMFGIEKQREAHGAAAVGNTYLYNSHLVHSVKEGQGKPEQQHHYPNAQTGAYSTRLLVFTAAGQLVEPIRRTLTRVVDAKAIGEMLLEFAQGAQLTPAELALNKEHVERMLRGVEEQTDACGVCAEIMNHLKAVGPISRKPNATKAEQDLRNQQANQKNRLLKQYNEHVKDPAFVANHESLVQPRFWSAWTDRAKKIQDSYQARDEQRKTGQSLLHSSMRTPHPHPRNLCSDKTEPAIFPDLERIDVGWLRNHKAPKENDFAVVRAAEVNDAFYLCRIVKIMKPTEDVLQQQLAKRRDFKIRTLQRGAAPGIVRIATPAVHPRLLALHDQPSDSLDATLLRTMAEVGCLEKNKRWRKIAAQDDRSLPWLRDMHAPCFEIRASAFASSGVNQPTSLGLFATRDIAKGEFIDWYAAHATPRDDFMDQRPGRLKLPRTHVCALPGSTFVMDGYPTASVLTRFIPNSADSLARMQLMPSSDFEPRIMYMHSALFRQEVGTLLNKWSSLPKGCLVNSAGGKLSKHSNCKRAMHTTGFKTLHFDAIPFIAATKDIRKGEELLCVYNNTEETKSTWRPFALPESGKRAQNASKPADKPSSGAPKPAGKVAVQVSAFVSAHASFFCRRCWRSSTIASSLHLAVQSECRAAAKVEDLQTHALEFAQPFVCLCVWRGMCAA